MDERIPRKGQQRCYVDVLHDGEVCTIPAAWVTLLIHTSMPHYLCGPHMAAELRDWPDSIVWVRKLRD